MDLLEYQAKELFRQFGIPVLPSQRIDHPRDLKALQVTYPVVLKSQVHSGRRAQAGGIRFVENTIDAVAAAQAIFHLAIAGEYPDVVLAEARFEAVQELYLAIAIDQSSRRPLLLGSQQGGAAVESVLKEMPQVIVEQEFSPYYARCLSIKMGLSGELIQSVSHVIERMYQLFAQKDLDLLEINPLAVGAKGELMALDGKVSVNDDALSRHADLAELKSLPQSNEKYAPALPPGVELMELKGNIASVCNGAGLTMATMDLVQKAGGRPGKFLNLGGEFCHDLPPTLLAERLVAGLDWLAQCRGVRVILVNVLGTVVSCRQLAEAIALYLRRQPKGRGTPPKLVVRLMGRQWEQAESLLNRLGISVFTNLDEAIAETVALSKNANH